MDIVETLWEKKCRGSTLCLPNFKKIHAKLKKLFKIVRGLFFWVTLYNPIPDLPTMHLLAKFGDPNFNPSKVIARTSPFFADLCCFGSIFSPK